MQTRFGTQALCRNSHMEFTEICCISVSLTKENDFREMISSASTTHHGL